LLTAIALFSLSDLLLHGTQPCRNSANLSSNASINRVHHQKNHLLHILSSNIITYTRTIAAILTQQAIHEHIITTLST
jgi:hypothetical protein